MSVSREVEFSHFVSAFVSQKASRDVAATRVLREKGFVQPWSSAPVKELGQAPLTVAMWHYRKNQTRTRSWEKSTTIFFLVYVAPIETPRRLWQLGWHYRELIKCIVTSRSKNSVNRKTLVWIHRYAILKVALKRKAIFLAFAKSSFTIPKKHACCEMMLRKREASQAEKCEWRHHLEVPAPVAVMP